MEYHRCYKCKFIYPKNSIFYFRDNQRKGGFETICKECRGYLFVKNENKIPEYKNCTMCGEEKKNNAINFLKVTSSNSSKCKKCNYKQNRKYKELNRLKILPQRKKYRDENKDMINNYFHTEKGKLSSRISSQKRRSNKKKTLSTLTNKEWFRCLEYFDYKCSYCGVHSNDLQQDHFFPLSKGGEYTSKNIVPSCNSCNQSKGDKLYFDWYPNSKVYSKDLEDKTLNYLGYRKREQQISLF